MPEYRCQVKVVKGNVQNDRALFQSLSTRGLHEVGLSMSIETADIKKTNFSATLICLSLGYNGAS